MSNKASGIDLDIDIDLNNATYRRCDGNAYRPALAQDRPLSSTINRLH